MVMKSTNGLPWTSVPLHLTVALLTRLLKRTDEMSYLHGLYFCHFSVGI